MRPSGSNATLRAAALSTRRAHESQVKILTFHMRYLNVHSSKYEIVLSTEGTEVCFHLPRYSERNRSPAALWGRPTCLYLGKVCSGGNSRGKL